MASLLGWRFCPRCSSELEVGSGRVDCPSCGFVAYASSVPTASALCLDERGRVLLARRAAEPLKGRWDLPGGFLEEGEEPLDGLRRELKEETGLAIEPGEFFAVTVDRYGDSEDASATLNLYWLAHVVEGNPEPADDVSELRWFAPDELPPREELSFDNIVDVLSRWQQQA